jgi:hypothetical protein
LQEFRERQHGKPLEFDEQTVSQSQLLDRVLERVDLNDPLLITESSGAQVEVSRTDFFKYFMPAGSSAAEAFHCFQAVRATGLNIFAPGECYFFKTGNNPVRLFVGYKAYIRKAYEGGMIHIEPPEIVFEENKRTPYMVTITVKIAGRPDFRWPTYFAEVAGRKGDGLNERWRRAPIQMLIKCAIVNLLRISGLCDFSGPLPYAIEEIDDPTVYGYRTLTQADLDEFSETGADSESGEVVEMEIGAVTADTHHIDMDQFRRSYFKRLKAMKFEFETDKLRREFQKNEFGFESVSDLDVEQWLTVFAKLGQLEEQNRALLNGQRKPAHDEGEEEGDPLDPQKPTDGPTNAVETAVTPGGQAEGASELIEAEAAAVVHVKQETIAELRGILQVFPGRKYFTIRSRTFLRRASEIIKRDIGSVTDMTDSEGQTVCEHLRLEKAGIERGPERAGRGVPESVSEAPDVQSDMAVRLAKLQKERAEAIAAAEAEAAEVSEEGKTEEKEAAARMNDGQFELMTVLIEQMPPRFTSIGSSNFRDLIFQTVKRKFQAIRDLTEDEAQDVLHVMHDMIDDENARLERLEEANKAASFLPE